MSRREVYGMDFAVSLVVITLDDMFLRSEVRTKSGWKRIGSLVSYTSEECEPGDNQEKTVRIYPKSWSDGSCIVCRMFSNHEGWHIESGSLFMNGSELFSIPTGFAFHQCSTSFIAPSGRGRPEDDIIREAARLRRPDLVGNPNFNL